jgi:hypothetical protein
MTSTNGALQTQVPQVTRRDVTAEMAISPCVFLRNHP